MKPQTLTLEHFLYGLLFLLALGLRLAPVAGLPLSDFEADHALRAFQAARGGPADLGVQPGYVLLTGLIFFLTGSGETSARLWPILAGASLVWLPYFFRGALGRKAALAAAVGLAFDPGLVALSQLAGGPMMAVSFGLLAAASWHFGRTVAAGILGGLALLAGPALFGGALGLAATWGLARAAGLIPARAAPPEEAAGKTPARAGILAAGGTLLLAGTLFLQYPQGLGALAASLPAYLEGWVSASGVSVFQLLIGFFGYPLLAVVFGIAGVVRSWWEADALARAGRLLSIWLGMALLLAAVYPGRQMGDLAWALIPLWGLAGLGFARYLEAEKGDFVAWGLAAFVVVMLASIWVNLAGLASSASQGQELLLRWLVIAGAVLLIGLSAMLVNMGWPGNAGKKGLAWGVAAALGISLLGGFRGLFSQEGSVLGEVWRAGPAAGQQVLLAQTVGDLSEWATGQRDSLQVVSLVDAPALRWALRGLPNVSFRTALGQGELPEAIITRQTEADLKLGSAYRGQDFVWWVHPVWDEWAAEEWLRWFLFRQGDGVPESIILWGRADLFPGGALNLEGAPLFDSGAGEEEPFIPEEELLDREDPLK